MARAQALFRQFLAERWFGGPDFESWVKQHGDVAAELVLLRDEWFARLVDEESPDSALNALGWRSAESFADGEVLGGFRLRRRLGAGAMGEVWEAEELALGGRLVALKLLRPDLVSDRRKLERFRREALAGARIRHPGVVAVYSAGRVHGQPYIAQELVEGGVTLAALIWSARRAGRPTPAHLERAARLIAQAADALQAAHDIGVVHRDIKPQNILVAAGDIVKVADFGLAHLAGENVLSETGDVMGTFCYMSPAQVQGRVKELDGRSDVFSLGATLYELLTFERAFPGDSAEEVMNRILNADPPPLRKKLPAAPRELELICSKALEKHPNDRYPSMRALADELRRHLAGEPILTGSTSAWRRARKWTRRHPTLFTSASVGVIALLVLAWLNREMLGAQAGRVSAERDTLYARAQWAIEMGDVERARQFIDQAVVLDPRDPTAHLILASGFARYSRIQDVEAQLRTAREKGFADDPQHLQSALELGAYGLYLQGKNDSELYPQAEEFIRRALALDPSLYPLQFALYRMRTAALDTAGALSALDAFMDRLPTGDPLYRMVEARRFELNGDARTALGVLEQVGQEFELDDAMLSGLNWHANIGRVCGRLGEFQRAETYLRQAVRDVPGDCWSWEALALTYFDRLQAGDATTATVTAARTCAQQAQACSPSLEGPYLITAYVAERTIGELGPAIDPCTDPSWAEARGSLDGVRSLRRHDPARLQLLESDLAFLDGRYHLRLSHHQRAKDLLETALELYPKNIRAAALLGECHWRMGQPAAGLEVLTSALETWDACDADEKPQQDWLGIILGWTLGNAAKAPDARTYRLALDRLLLELEKDARFNPEDLLNAAEFLATAPGEMRECDLALYLVESQKLHSAFEGTSNALEAEHILERIERACR